MSDEFIQIQTWFIELSTSSFTPIVLEVDSDEILTVCNDDDWYICHTSDPTDDKIPFPIPKGNPWSLVFGVRRLDAGSTIGYAKSKSVEGAILHCYNTLPPPGIK
jgi:hypothetical protein